MNSQEFTRANYGRAAGIYDKLELLLGGSLENTRNAFLGNLPFAPKNPIIVGCGPGSFPVAFARAENPDRLTINDIAPEMLARSRSRLAASGWRGTLIHLQGEITSLGLPRQYDFLAVQFLLDCFPQASRVHMLGELQKLLTPGAILLVSGYSRPKSRWLLPLFYLNYGAALLAFRVLVNHPLNRPGNIEQAILDSGLTIHASRSFLFGLFSSWLVRLD